jgi:hypothetical protein
MTFLYSDSDSESDLDLDLDLDNRQGRVRVVGVLYILLDFSADKLF